MFCWLFGHLYHERQWGACVRCGHAEPPEPLTFDEGYYHGLREVEDIIRKWAITLEEKNSQITAVEALRMLVKKLQERSELHDSES